MESIDKLREYGHECCARIDDTVHDLADAIEAEIAERYMKLPLDADGVPIRLGDVMDGVGLYDTLRDVTGEVIEVSFNATDDNECVESVALQVWSEDGESWRRIYIDQYAGRYCHHVEPRTVEDVLRDAGVSVAAVSDVAAEIRELMEVDA